MSAEQLLESLVQATGFRAAQGSAGINSLKAQFVTRFASQENRTEHQTSILQALTLMNGKFVEDATSLERSETLIAVAEAPFLNTGERVESLFLATLSRKPHSDEAANFVKYVNSGGAKGDSKSALADVFWALLNSGEFMLNH